MYEPIIQTLHTGGEATISTLIRRELKIEQIAIPGIVVTGGLIQVVGIYLIPDSIPAIAYLSDPINIVSYNGRLQLAFMLKVLANFLHETITYITRRKFKKKFS